MVSVDLDELKSVINDSGMESVSNVDIGMYEGGRVYFIEDTSKLDSGVSYFSAHVTFFNKSRGCLKGKCLELFNLSGSASEYLNDLGIDPSYHEDEDSLPFRAVILEDFSFIGDKDDSYRALLECLDDEFKGDLLIIPENTGIGCRNAKEMKSGDKAGFLSELPLLIDKGDVIELI